MVSIQRMRLLLPNVDVNLDAELIRPISKLFDDFVVRHGLKPTVLMLYDAGFGPTAFRLRPPNASGRIAANRISSVLLCAIMGRSHAGQLS